jgi:hypothetical protein
MFKQAQIKVARICRSSASVLTATEIPLVCLMDAGYLPDVL